MVSRKVSRRRFVAGTTAVSTALVAAPFVRGAHAAGKLSLGLWDHWVPGANKTSEALIVSDVVRPRRGRELSA